MADPSFPSPARGRGQGEGLRRSSGTEEKKKKKKKKKALTYVPPLRFVRGTNQAAHPLPRAGEEEVSKGTSASPPRASAWRDRKRHRRGRRRRRSCGPAA